MCGNGDHGIKHGGAMKCGYQVGTVAEVHSTLVGSCCTGAFVVKGSTLGGGTGNVTGSGCCSNCGTCKG
eukprot:3064273-Ditylum_brightwellii.AAC.1